MPRFLRSPLVPPLLVALAAFLVYLRTLAPTVSFIDSGELATVVCTLGIAHPTGYPLFTLLGRLFSMLPLAGEQIVRLNVMAAVFCAAGVFVFTQISRLLFTRMALQPGGVSPKSTGPSSAPAWASAGAGLMLAFSATYWAQALSIEVYSLHLLLLLTTTLLFLRALYPQSSRAGANVAAPGESRWYIFAFVLGLCFTNHMTTVLLAPAFLYLYFTLEGAGVTSWRRIGRMAGPFLLGLSLYAYLPLRASRSPALNWGNTVSLERLWWHFTGKQYRVWLFGSTGAAGRQLSHFLETLAGEFTVVGLLLAVIGAALLWRAQRKLFAWSAILFVSCVLYSINYDIHDIDSYFLLAYVCMALWSGVAMHAIVTRLARRVRGKVVWAGAVAVVLGLIPLFGNYRAEDESADYLVEDYTMNMFQSLPPRTVMMSYQWDYWMSSSLYYQLVKGVRTDCVLIDKELLRRSWYLKELEGRYPWLIQESRPEVDAFLRELSRFEHDLPYDAAVIEARYTSMIASFLVRSGMNRPLYVTAEIEEKYTQGFQRVPDGLAYRLEPDTAFHPTEFRAFGYRPFARGGRLEDGLKGMYVNACLARGSYYYSKRRDMAEADRAFRQALVYEPASPVARRLVASLEAMKGSAAKQVPQEEKKRQRR